MVSFPSDFPTKALFTPLPIRATCPAHRILDFITQTILGDYRSLSRCLCRTKVSVQVRGFLCEHFVTRYFFYGGGLLALRPSPKLDYYPLSAVRDCFIFAATHHIGGRSSFRNLRTGINATELNFNVYYVCPARRLLATCIKFESISWRGIGLVVSYVVFN